MAAPQPQATRRNASQDLFILPVLKYSTVTGVGSGAVGAAVGGATGLFRSTTPALFALVSGAQCFSLGFAFTAARTVSVEILSQIQKKPPSGLSANDRRIASLMGGVAAGGATASIFRGRANVLPGVLVWGALGLAGQFGVDVLSPRLEASEDTVSRSLVDRITSSKWSPMTRLSDEEYEGILKERLLRVEADIALVDEDIMKLEANSKGKD